MQDVKDKLCLNSYFILKFYFYFLLYLPYIFFVGFR